jgi:hypothetical protein
MGRERNKENAPGLFAREDGSLPFARSTELRQVRQQRWALPKDLGKALQFLDDEQVDRLLSAVTEEANRRSRPHPDTDVAKTGPAAGVAKSVPKHSRSKAVAAEADGTHLTKGQLNAVNAAFRAGVTPARIARQFGLSHAQVRAALAKRPT